MSEIRLRDATPADTDAIRGVTLAANVQYELVSAMLWEGYKQNILETLADVTPAQQIVAEQNGEILGTVLLYPGETVFHRADGSPFTLDSFEVRLLAVTPAARKQGIAKALMLECIARARRANATAVTLHTADFMQVAKAMYERMGFVRAPEMDFEGAPKFVIKGYRYSLA